MQRSKMNISKIYTVKKKKYLKVLELFKSSFIKKETEFVFEKQKLAWIFVFTEKVALGTNGLIVNCVFATGSRKNLQIV